MSVSHSEVSMGDTPTPDLTVVPSISDSCETNWRSFLGAYENFVANIDKAQCAFSDNAGQQTMVWKMSYDQCKTLAKSKFDKLISFASVNPIDCDDLVRYERLVLLSDTVRYVTFFMCIVESVSCGRFAFFSALHNLGVRLEYDEASLIVKKMKDATEVLKKAYLSKVCDGLSLQDTLEKLQNAVVEPDRLFRVIGSGLFWNSSQDQPFRTPYFCMKSSYDDVRSSIDSCEDAMRWTSGR